MLKDERNSFYLIYEVLMGLLAFLVVILLGLRLFFELEPTTEKIFFSIEWVILLLFALDYGARFFRAPHKGSFFRSNFWDLIAIMPFSSAFRAARFVRLVRTVVFFRRSLLGLLSFMRTNYLYVMILVTFFVIYLGALGLYQVEKGLTVDSFADSLWWSLVTITSVGYGDITPVTIRGRILAAILMFIGIGFIGMVTGTIATFFLRRVQRRTSHPSTCDHEVLGGVIDRLHRFHELNYQEVEEIGRVLCVLKSKERKE